MTVIIIIMSVVKLEASAIDTNEQVIRVDKTRRLTSLHYTTLQARAGQYSAVQWSKVQYSAGRWSEVQYRAVE